MARDVLMTLAMRNEGSKVGIMGGVVMLCAGACAATLRPTVPAVPVRGVELACQQTGMRVYDYDDHVAVTGLGVEIETSNGWTDSDGRHFAVWVRLADRRPVAVEVVFPKDQPGVAETRVFDLGPGRSLDVIAGADGVWRIGARPTTVASCRSYDAEDQALALWLSGEPCDEIAVRLGTDRDNAEHLVGVALRDARRRYQDER